MRCAQNHAEGTARTHSFMNDRDRCTVAMPEENWPLNGQLCEEPRQDLESFVMHVIRPTGFRQCVGKSVAVTRIHEGVAAARGREPVGKVLPKRNRTQSLVQEYERR